MKKFHSAYVTTLALLGSFLPTPEMAKITALVVDEISGEPIEGVSVSGVFRVECNPWERVKGSPSPNIDQKRTDTNGRCELKGRTNNGRVLCLLDDGPNSHYWVMQGGGYRFKSKNILGVWQPDNVVVTIKLQRVEHPITLFVKNVREPDRKRDLFAEGGGRIAFDFLEGEWLPPVGNGKVADVEFERLPREDLGDAENQGLKAKAYRDSMTVKFLGVDNGLIEMKALQSDWLKVRTAPEAGYGSDYLCWDAYNKHMKVETNYSPNRCFCFRIRTKHDEHGNIVGAYYGKIYGDIKFEYKNNPFVPVATVQMRYYLNPTSLDRNLEWDMKTNLCPNPGEVPKEP